MTNPGNAVGTNGAYGGRTSVNAFNDVLAAFSGRGILQGWSVAPSEGMAVTLGGAALVRDVAIVQNDIGQKTTLNNISNQPIPITLSDAPALGSRIDVIVGYVNNPPDMPTGITDIPADNPNVCGLIVVEGNVSESPVAPDESMIRAAITADGASGTTAYYVLMATISVPNGSTVITSSQITQGPIASLGMAAIGDGSVTTPKIADAAVTSSKIDWTTQALTPSRVSSKVINNQLRVARYGKLISTTGPFQLNGDIVTGEEIYFIPGVQLLNPLTPSNALVGVNIDDGVRIRWNGVDRTVNAEWFQFCTFGFLV